MKRGKLVTTLFWACLLSVSVTTILIAIGWLGYWSIPPYPAHYDGGPLFSYDPEIGYVAQPNGSTRLTLTDADGKTLLHFPVYTDRRGARVGHQGEQTPSLVDVIILGDSFAWGQGVEGHETFAAKMVGGLGVSGANLALAAYGTTHALQLLRRHHDLAPKLVVLELVRDHLWRNVSPCARSGYPFCLDYAHVEWNAQGQPFIAPPLSNGVARIRRQIRAEGAGLAPATWIIHGLDVIVARARSRVADLTASDLGKQRAALEFLIREVASTAKAMHATLLIVFVPDQSLIPAPGMLSRSAHGGLSVVDYQLLDLSETFAGLDAEARAKLYIPKDGHPSVAGHALIARELVAFIRRERLLASKLN